MAHKVTAQTELQRNWFTISSLVSKDFKLKYRRSVLGVAWSVLNPLLMMCVLAAVFTNVLKFGDVANFPMYLILGNVLFALMSDSTSTAMTSILESAPLIKKIKISKMIFPIEKVLFQLVNFAISLIAVVIVMVFFRIAPTVNLLALPLLLVYMLLFAAVWVCCFPRWPFSSATSAIFGASSSRHGHTQRRFSTP